MRLLMLTVALLFGLNSSIFASQMMTGGDKVYVCSSKTSTTYHKTQDCGGLKKCKAKVNEEDKAQAEKEGRTACKVCFKSTGNNGGKKATAKPAAPAPAPAK